MGFTFPLQKKQKFNYNDLNSESVLFSLHEIRKKSVNTSDNLINANHLFAKEKGLTNYIFFDEELDFLPTKISNNQNATKYFLKIVQNPSKFCDSLDYNKKRREYDPTKEIPNPFLDALLLPFHFVDAALAPKGKKLN